MPRVERRLMAALVVAAAGLVSGTLTAAGWTRTTSSHFEIYTSGGEKRAREALAYLEPVRGFFDAFLSLPPSTRLATRVILFSNDTEFDPYRGSYSAAAYYQPARDRDYIVLRAFDENSQPVIVHEYAHLALERSGASYPAWLSEGLAEFFSTMSPERGRMVLGRAPAGRVSTLQTESMLPVSRLLEVDRESPEYASSHAGVFYAESWALTHMLAAGERYQPKVDQFLAMVARGTPAAKALVTVYQKSVTDIDRDLRLYVKVGYFRQLSAPYAAMQSAPQSETTAIDTFDAHLVLANLLAAGRNRETAARASFDALSRERPDRADVAVSRGLFELQAGHNDDAAKWLERAISGGTTDPAAHAELARLVEPLDLAKSTALLDTALALAPDDAMVRVRAAANLVHRHKPADALAMTSRIDNVSRLPTEQQFLFHQVVANAHLLLGEFDQAVAAAARVVDLARTPDERRFGESLMKDASGPADMTDVVRGRLRHVQCDGPMPILTVLTDAGTIRLVVDAPAKIVVPGGIASELTCGEQDRPLRVGYSRGGAPQGTHGLVRFLDFK